MDPAAGKEVPAAQVFFRGRLAVALVVNQLEVDQAGYEARHGHRQHAYHDEQAPGYAAAHVAHRPLPSVDDAPVLDFIFDHIREGETSPESIPTRTRRLGTGASREGGSAGAQSASAGPAGPR